jgi:predicted PurR-regulated permease PerM
VISNFPSGFAIALAAGILGVIPMLMPLLILPCLAYMYLSGGTTWAIVGAIDLAIVWFVFENIVKPQVIGKKVKINTFIILASMIGGMQLLGFLGLFVGPAIVSMSIGITKELLVSQD